MTPTTTVTPSGGTPDMAAFRSVLAAPEEALVVCLSDNYVHETFGRVLDAIETLRNTGTRCKLVVLGGTSGVPPPDEASEGGTVYLERWALPMLPPVLEAADVVLALGEEGSDLLYEHKASCRGLAILARESLPESLSGIGRVSTSWEGQDVAPLVEILRRELSHYALPGSHRTGRTASSPAIAPAKSNSDPGRPSTARGQGLAVRESCAGTFILRNEWGIGDELLLSAVAREIVRAHPATEIWIRTRHGFRFKNYVRTDTAPANAKPVEIIYQNPTLYAPKAHSPFPGHLVQQMLDKFTVDTGIKVLAKDVSPELDLSGYRREVVEHPTVILHTRPNNRLSSKDWGLERWRELSELLIDAGVRVRQVGGRDEPHLEGAEDLRGILPKDLPGIFVRSSLVVCVVGFLMHLAKATNLPAVVIYGGREHPAIDGYPDQVHLSSEPLPCRGRWGCHLGPDLHCEHGMQCMRHISPELVAHHVLNLLEVAKP